MNPYINQASNVPRRSKTRFAVGLQINTSNGIGTITDIRAKTYTNPYVPITLWLVTVVIPGYGVEILEVSTLVFSSGIGGQVAVPDQNDSIL